MVLPPPPPAPVAPPRPDLITRDGAGRGARWIALGVGVALIGFVVVIALVDVGGGSGDRLPEQVDGLDRIHGGIATTFEEELGTFEMGEMSIVGAMYGSGTVPQLFVERFDGEEEDLPFVPLETFFDGLILGFEQSGGGQIDEATEVEDERSGVEVRCAVVEGMPALIASSGAGTMCAWKGAGLGVVFDFRDSDVEAALDTTVRIASSVEQAAA
jgi:hypothetical protein